MTHQPAEEMNLMANVWPFMQWEIYLIRLFKRAKGNKEYLVVAMDYFTKWIEAEPLSWITEAAIKVFVWKNIICRFGIPHTIISDNGLQFTSFIVTNMYKELGIRYLTSTPRYPQSIR